MRALRPWSHAAIGQDQRKPIAVIGRFALNEPLPRHRTCDRTRVYTESGGKIQLQRGTSSRTLHWRPCRAIDRCVRPLDLSSFVAITNNLSYSQRINLFIFSRTSKEEHFVLLIFVHYVWCTWFECMKKCCGKMIAHSFFEKAFFFEMDKEL